MRELLVKNGYVSADVADVLIRPPLESERLEVVACGRFRIELRSKVGSATRVWVQIRSKKFEPTHHEIRWENCGLKGARVLAAVDGHEVYGVDTVVPATYISTVEVAVDGRHFNLDATEYNDLFNPLLCREKPRVEYVRAYYSSRRDEVAIYLSGSDGALGYCVKWLVGTGGRTLRVVLPYDLSVYCDMI